MKILLAQINARCIVCAAWLALLMTPGCLGGVLLRAVRPFQASALRGQDPTPAREEERARFVSAEALLRDVTYLSSPDCEGRATGTRGNALARAYIKARMAEAGLAVHEQVFAFERTEETTREASNPAVNVLGALPGTNPDAPWIVISAHYDHLGYSERERDFYYGADDNAAGVAALFALASYFSRHPLTHPILFVAFDAEELGLIGASRFLRDNTLVAREDIAFNVNLDMISRSEERELFAVTHYVPAQDPLRAILFELQPQVGYRLMVSRDDKSLQSLGSDHLMFLRAEIPFIYLGVANHADYHRVSDRVDKIDPVFYTAVVDSCVLLIQRLDGYLPLAKRPTPEGS